MFQAVGARRSALPWFAGGAGLIVAVAVSTAAWWWLGEPALAPPSEIATAIPASDAVAGGIALEELHRTLWTAWSVARPPADRQAAADAIVGALAGDEALAGIARSVMDAATSGDRRTAADAAHVYDAALAARGMRWAVQPGWSASGAYVKTYWLPARATVSLDGRPAEIRFGLRADTLNVVEGWLGLAEDMGDALVVVDRVSDFAVDRLWPLLDGQGALASAVSAEAQAHLSPGDLAVLRRTAAHRARMVAARDAVDGRRSCGSRFRLRFGWAGVDELARLRDYARRFRGEPCPGITPAEADAVVRGTLAIRTDPKLPRALEALVAWAARHVAVHEARHRLDHADWGFGTPPPCPGCPPLDDRARIEASAYLSTLASGEAVMGLVQGCSVLDAGGAGAGERALRAVLSAMEVACDAAPPADLRERAADVSAAWFEREEGEATFADLPDGLPLGR